MTVRYRAPGRELPAATAAIMLEVAADYGLDPRQVLAGTAVDEYSLSSPGTTIALRDSMRMLDNCVRLSGEPAFALYFGSRITLAALGALGYAFMSCRDLEQLLGILLRYHRLLAANFSIRLEPQRDGLVIALDAVEKSAAPLQRECEVFLAGAVSTLRRLFPARSLTLRARFAYPEPEYRSVYERLITADLEFDAPTTQLWLEKQLLLERLQFANPTMLKLYQQQCDALLAVTGGGGFSEEVRRFLLESPGRFPGIEGAAQHFHMSARTLRRRLQAEGWTYQRIVHEMRCQLAETYLRDSVLSIAEIAQMLGYGDVSNFRRAFIGWTGRSPAACRRQARQERGRLPERG